VITQFEKLFPRVPNLEKAGVKTPYSDIISWFENNDMLELNYTDNDASFNQAIESIIPLTKLVNEYWGNRSEAEKRFCMELVLWALVVAKKLDKTETEKALSFDVNSLGRNMYGDN
jgi:magnesium chelatase subunit I